MTDPSAPPRSPELFKSLLRAAKNSPASHTRDWLVAIQGKYGDAGAAEWLDDVLLSYVQFLSNATDEQMERLFVEMKEGIPPLVTRQKYKKLINSLPGEPDFTPPSLRPIQGEVLDRREAMITLFGGATAAAAGVGSLGTGLIGDYHRRKSGQHNDKAMEVWKSAAYTARWRLNSHITDHPPKDYNEVSEAFEEIRQDLIERRKSEWHSIEDMRKRNPAAAERLDRVFDRNLNESNRELYEIEAEARERTRHDRVEANAEMETARNYSLMAAALGAIALRGVYLLFSEGYNDDIKTQASKRLEEQTGRFNERFKEASGGNFKMPAEEMAGMLWEMACDICEPKLKKAIAERPGPGRA